MVTALGRVL